MSVAGIVTFLEEIVYFGRGASEAIHVRELYCYGGREKGQEGE